jgi:hypothetical protein
MRKLLKIVIALSATLVCVYLLLSYYVLRTFRLQFSPPEITNTSEAIGRELDRIEAAVHDGAIPSGKSHLKSVGAPREELRLLTLREELLIFEFEYGRAPKDESDFAVLATNTALPAQRRAAILRYARECKILTFSGDSYLLNCDGWRPQTAEEIKALLGNFSNAVERFYLVSSHVFLYAPPMVARRPYGTP